MCSINVFRSQSSKENFRENILLYFNCRMYPCHLVRITQLIEQKSKTFSIEKKIVIFPLNIFNDKTTSEMSEIFFVFYSIGVPTTTNQYWNTIHWVIYFIIFLFFSSETHFRSCIKCSYLLIKALKKHYLNHKDQKGRTY